MSRYFLNEQSITDEDVRDIFSSNASNVMAIRVANAHHGVDVINRLSNNGIDFCFSEMERRGSGTFLTLDQYKGAPWSDHSTEQSLFFENLESIIQQQTDVDGLLLSGGIDSLVLTLASPHDIPCYTWDVERGQTEFAKYLCEKLGKKHIIIRSADDENKSKNDEMLEKSMFLRSKYLGHYLPWNSGITSRHEFHNKKLISGQNADSLLMVDTFAPVFNSYGIRRVIELLSTIKFRRVLNEHAIANVFSEAELSDLFCQVIALTLTSDREHVKIDKDTLLASKLDMNHDTKMFLNLINFQSFSEFGDYTFALKKFKYARFVAPAIESYRQQEEVFGLTRVLPYSTSKLLPLILNYVPSRRNLNQPKSIFYDYCATKGVDFNSEKADVLRKELGRAYLVKRLLAKRKFEYSEYAIKQMTLEAQHIGVSMSRCLGLLDLTYEQLNSKPHLMRLDRLLNYLSFTGHKL